MYNTACKNRGYPWATLLPKRSVYVLQAAFKSVFPIESFNGSAALEFVSYRLGTPAFDVRECQQRGLIFAAPLRVKMRLVIYNKEEGKSTGAKAIKEVKEQEVYLGDMPLMTDNGTFVNGWISSLTLKTYCSSVLTVVVSLRPQFFYVH